MSSPRSPARWGSVLLGLTVGCARCHDHKFDAIPSTDYYRLQSFFAASDLVDQPIAPKAELEAFETAKKAVERKAAPLREQLAALEAPYRKSLTEQKQAMLTAGVRAVMAVPEAKRTPAQKRLVQGLQNSLRVTWEDVAAAVAASLADHPKRETIVAMARSHATNSGGMLGEPLPHLLIGPGPLKGMGVEPVVLRPGGHTCSMNSSRLLQDARFR